LKGGRVDGGGLPCRWHVEGSGGRGRIVVVAAVVVVAVVVVMMMLWVEVPGWVVAVRANGMRGELRVELEG
jgi:hypothetical protein